MNYSKWDKLELSDDEDNFHPNIDNNLMIRLQREKRQQREAEEAERKQKLLTVPLRLRHARGAVAYVLRLRSTAPSANLRRTRQKQRLRWRRLRGWPSCTSGTSAKTSTHS